jgi:hypothetical protein
MQDHARIAIFSLNCEMMHRREIGFDKIRIDHRCRRLLPARAIHAAVCCIIKLRPADEPDDSPL